MKADVCPGFASCLTDYWGEILDSDQAGGCWGGGVCSLVCSAVLQQRAATDGIVFKWAAYRGRMVGLVTNRKENADSVSWLSADSMSCINVHGALLIIISSSITIN